MIDLKAYLEKKLRDIISAWNEDDIYAISFLFTQMRHMNTTDIQMLLNFT